jgi:hypothetical protein
MPAHRSALDFSAQGHGGGLGAVTRLTHRVTVVPADQGKSIVAFAT